MEKSLRLGDILVFKAGDDWLGKSIAWITNSNVSHAAMVYKTDSIVEMGASGIGVSRVTTETGEEAYLMRLNPEKAPQPLIEAADAYINAKTRYDFPALVILAGLLIYRHIRPTQKLVKIYDLILRAACKEVDKLIQSLVLHNQDKAMVCSQLVYQIYSDCGEAYSIQLEGGDLQSAAMPKCACNTIRLIDLLDSAREELPDTLYVSNDWESAEQNPEVLARQLMEALQEENGEEMEFQAVNVESLLVLAQKLIKGLEKFLEESHVNIPLDALFVTPSDLLNHAKNIKQVGTVKISRQR